MFQYADLFERKTGVRLYPGSLNAILDEPWIVADAALRLEPPEYGVALTIVPCEIDGVRAFIIRTDKNNAGLGDRPPNGLEIAAPTHLRTNLGLSDGDEVEIVILRQAQWVADL